MKNLQTKTFGLKKQRYFFIINFQPTNEQRINKKLLFPSEDSELIQYEESSQSHVP